MYLEKAQIVNFRGIRKLEIDFEEDTSILIGENHWGKTSLLRALWMMLGNGEKLCSFSKDDLYVPLPKLEEDIEEQSELLCDKVREARRKKDNNALVLELSEMSNPIGQNANLFSEVQAEINKPIQKKNNTKSKEHICIDLWFKQGKKVSESDLDPSFKNYWFKDDKGELVIHWQARAYTNWLGNFVTYHFLLNKLNKPIGKFKITKNSILRLISYNPVFRLRDRRMEGDFSSYTDDNQKIMLSDLMENDPEFSGFDVSKIFEAFSAFMDKYITSYAQNELKNKNISYSRNIDDIVKRPVSLESINSIRQTLAKPGINKSKILASYVLLSFVLAKGDRDFNLLANPIIILEDIDSRFHPTMLLSFFSLVSSTAAQKIVTTNSGDLLSTINLESLRRLQKNGLDTDCYKIRAGALKEEDLRKIAFHIRINRPLALFARTWILVEGETEVWVLTQIAAILGISLPCEGIRIIEFAQCGLNPLVKIAKNLGIKVHILTDGDDAGENYAKRASSFFKKQNINEHLTVLPQKDIEHYLYTQGYAGIFKEAAGFAQSSLPKGISVDKVINMAIKRKSKPGLALLLVEAMQRKGVRGVPLAFAELLDRVRSLDKEKLF